MWRSSFSFSMRSVRVSNLYFYLHIIHKYIISIHCTSTPILNIQCRDEFCDLCYKAMHRKGARKQHTHKQLREDTKLNVCINTSSSIYLFDLFIQFIISYDHSLTPYCLNILSSLNNIYNSITILYIYLYFVPG